MKKLTCRKVVWDEKQKQKRKQSERAGMKGSVMGVCERTRVRGHTLRMNVSRLNALEKAPHVNPGAMTEAGWAVGSPAEFLISPPYLRLEMKALNCLFRFSHGSFPKIPVWEQELLRTANVWPSLLTNCDLYFNLVNVFLAKAFPWNSALDSQDLFLE